MSVIELGEENLSSKARQYLDKEEFHAIDIPSNSPVYLTDQVDQKNSTTWWAGRRLYSLDYEDKLLFLITQPRSWGGWYLMYHHYDKTTRALTYVEEFIANMDDDAPSYLDGDTFHVNYRTWAPVLYHRDLDLDTLVLAAEWAGYDTTWTIEGNSLTYISRTRVTYANVCDDCIINYVQIT